jgi:hypothetical protein
MNIAIAQRKALWTCPLAILQSNTSPQSELGAPRTLRLDLNSVNTDVGKPFVKMSAY